MYPNRSTGDWQEFGDSARKLKWVDEIAETDPGRILRQESRRPLRAGRPTSAAQLDSQPHATRKRGRRRPPVCSAPAPRSGGLLLPVQPRQLLPAHSLTGASARPMLINSYFRPHPACVRMRELYRHSVSLEPPAPARQNFAVAAVYDRRLRHTQSAVTMPTEATFNPPPVHRPGPF